jgi:excisionase family DNA binding protein
MNALGAVSIKDFCQRYSLGRTKTYELIGNGELPVTKIGKKTLIRISDAETLLSKFSSNPAPSSPSNGGDD